MKFLNFFFFFFFFFFFLTFQMQKDKIIAYIDIDLLIKKFK